jgi:TolA-binding protein
MFLKKDATAEDVKKSHPLVYDEISESIKAQFQAQISDLTEQVNAFKAAQAVVVKNQKITDFGSKMKCSAFTETLIKENPEISVEDAFIKISENSGTDKDTLAQAQEIFEKTAPASAGNGNKDDLGSLEINTFEQAVSHIQKRDSLSKAAATRIARIEYTDLLIKKVSN